MITVPPSILDRVTRSYGEYFSRLSRLSPEKCSRDVLDERKVHDQIALFCRTFSVSPEELRNQRLLEIGSGLGIFLAVTRKHYGIESSGIEPATEGFDSNLKISREILLGYGLDPAIVRDAKGESLPFADESFDLIFSSTVLEHTQDPAKVLAEAIRVLKPGGRLQFIYPNYGAFFEGHYAIPWIPYLNHSLGRLWVRLWGRDPSFVATLSLTNYFRTRRWLRAHRGHIRVVTLGEGIFEERMLGRQIQAWAGLGRVQRWLETLHRLRLARPVTWVLLKVKSFDPIILSLVKTQPPSPPAI